MENVIFIILYDYIDSNISKFDDMYAKRLKAYKRIGYSLQVDGAIEKQQANSIFDYESYVKVYSLDLSSAEKSIVISSPSMSFKKVNAFINEMKPLQERGVKVTVLTWAPDLYKHGDATRKIELIEILTSAGIEVQLYEDGCLHFAVIDNFIVWYGSMNLLGKEDIEDNIMRVESDEIAVEILSLSYTEE